MYWDRITDKLKQFAGGTGQQWGRLADDQLDVISGKRDYIAGNVPEAHAMSADDTEKHLTDWHSRVKEMGYVK